MFQVDLEFGQLQKKLVISLNVYIVGFILFASRI